MGEAIGDESAEFFAKFVAVNESIAEGDESHGNFSGSGVRTADNPAFLNRRMFQ